MNKRSRMSREARSALERALKQRDERLSVFMNRVGNFFRRVGIDLPPLPPKIVSLSWWQRFSMWWRHRRIPSAYARRSH